MLCPACQSRLAKEPIKYGDNTVYKCKGCGSYQLSGDVIDEFVTHKLPVSNLAAFRQMAREKRIGTDSFLVITSDDICGLSI